MPRASRRSAPSRAPAHTRSAHTAAAPAAAPPPVAAPPVAQPRQPGMFAQMASTAAGVAVGSAVGHTIGAGLTGMFSGGESAPAPAPAQAAQTTENNYARSCDADARQLTKCLEDNNGNMQICDFYLQQLKSCQEMAKQY